MTKTFKLSTCKQCGLKYQPCTWLAHRTVGLCSEKCFDAYKPVTL